MDTEESEPKTDDLKTLFEWKIPRKVLRVMDNDFAKMFFILLLMALGFLSLGGIQFFFICKPANDDVTFMQCITHTEPRAKHK